MDSEQKPPSVLQLAWMLVAVLAFAGFMFHLDREAGDHYSTIPARDLVGAWVVDFGGRGTCTEMHADGTYTAVDFGIGADDRPRRGTWSVTAEVLTWNGTPRSGGDSEWMLNASSDRFTTQTRWLDTGYHDAYARLVHRRLPGLAARCTPVALAEFQT